MILTPQGITSVQVNTRKSPISKAHSHPRDCSVVSRTGHQPGVSETLLEPTDSVLGLGYMEKYEYHGSQLGLFAIIYCITTSV